MAEAQPPTIVEGATTGDIEDEIPGAARSAEGRKEEAALSSLDGPRDDEAGASKDVDRDAVRKAMDRLSGKTEGAEKKKVEVEPKEVKKVVKVDQADVALLVSLHLLSPLLGGSGYGDKLCVNWHGMGSLVVGIVLMLSFYKVEQLDFNKVRATDLLRAHDGDAVKALKAYVSTPVY